MSSAGPVVGVDVSKATLDVAVGADARVQRFANTPPGHRRLGRYLATLNPARVVLEATGGYERKVLRHLSDLKLRAVRVNPRQVRDFAKADGILAKTDALDARVLARFGLKMEPEHRPLPGPEQETLKELVQRRRQLVGMRTEEKNRAEKSPCPVVARSVRTMVNAIDKQIDQLESEVADLIAAHKTMARKLEVLASIPGIGATTAAVIMAGLPELGDLSRQAVASLAGLAPFNHDSGNHKGERTIRGGRPHVRTALYMATLSAVKHNPSIRQTYQRLTDNGKAPKLALVACMRKLITVANALVREDQLWTDRTAKNDTEST